MMRLRSRFARSMNGNVNLFKQRERKNNQGQFASVVIDENGLIESIDAAGPNFLGSASIFLKARHISILIPEFNQFTLLRNDEINPRLKFLTRIGKSFQVNKFNGGCMLCRMCVHLVERSGMHLVRIMLRPSGSGST